MKHLLLLLLWLPVLSPASADIVKCGDTWTNGSCDKEPATAITEKPFEEQKKDFRMASLKKSLLHDFTTARLDAKRRYNIQTSSSYIEEVCSEPAYTVEKCRDEIDREEARLLEKVKIAQQKEDKEVEEKKKTASSSEQNSVVVQDIDNYWLNRYGRPNRWPPQAERPGTPPIVKPRTPSNFTSPSLYRNKERTPNPQLGNQ